MNYVKMRMRIGFSKRLYLSVIGVFVLFAVCFVLFQFHREKAYKLELMQNRMQIYNYEMMETLGDRIMEQKAFMDYVAAHHREGIHVCVIDTSGNIMLDSNGGGKKVRLRNFKNRPEVRQAMKSGNGYGIYGGGEDGMGPKSFCFATYFSDENIVVSSSVPYNSRLEHSLEADSQYLIFAVIVTILLGFVLYRNTHRLGEHIRHLRNFAAKAEGADQLDTELQMDVPDDELGEISHNIISLYWKLKHSEEDKLRIKRQLTQNMAHELKTPAASIQGYLETIINNPDMSEEQKKHFIERCYAQSIRMSKLLYDMSALTKMDETGRLQMCESINIASLVASIMEDAELEVKKRNMKVETDIPSDTVVKGDMTLLYSIFRNLTDNAIAYAGEGASLKIQCTDKGDRYMFTVADNGPGVEPQHLAHLFERFYRVDKGRSRKLGGTGLGMAIVKNAIVLHGGNVVAKHTPGGGLTIEFDIKKDASEKSN